MKQSQIQDWLIYWQNADMVAFDEIRAFEHVAQARKYCSCMRIGVFVDVTDLQIWRALCNMRDSDKFADLAVA